MLKSVLGRALLCYVNFSKEMDEFRSAIALWVNIYDIFGWSIQIL
jgi:hypothetical protein